MEFACELCPDFSTKSKAVKRRHKGDHKKKGEFLSDGISEKEGGQGGKGGNLVGGGGRGQAQGSREGLQEAGGCLGKKVMSGGHALKKIMFLTLKKSKQFDFFWFLCVSNTCVDFQS